MARQLFDWYVDVGTNGQFDFAVLEGKFGDGYVQSAADGIHNERQTWPISMFGERENLMPAANFIRARKGVTSFNWVTPWGEQIAVVGKDLKVTSEGGDSYTLTATFEQRFEP